MDQLSTNLWRHISSLSGPHQPAVSFVWRTGDRVMLVDPTGDLTADRLPQGLHVTDICVTHMQAEHVAGAQHYPGARVHVPHGDEYLCAGSDHYAALHANWPAPWAWDDRGCDQGYVAGAANERPLGPPIATSSTLAPGDSIFGAMVVATPGHGKHAITLIAAIDGETTAFCGDLIYGDGMLWNWFDAEWDYGYETGQKTLKQSAQRLCEMEIQILCPAHGPVIREPRAALTKLTERLDAIWNIPLMTSPSPINFPDAPSAPGFRRITPHLHQYRDGNCAVLLSQSGNALLVDDGLCYWKPLDERKQHHADVILAMKSALGVRNIEVVIPTHYHGDHTENIPDLVVAEGTKVVCLDTAAEPIEFPDRFNLACLLPWYGAGHAKIPIDIKVEDRSIFRWHEYDIEIFHLAGQTYYHLGAAVLVDGLKTLFVGDAIHLVYPVATGPICYNDAEPAERGWACSLDRMIERRPDLLVCGHGSAIRDPMPLLGELRLMWDRQLEHFAALNSRDSFRQFFDPFL